MVKHFFQNGHRIFSKQQTNILSAAAVITLANFISALFGLIKTYLLLKNFSATKELQAILDAYWVALRLPELVFQLLVVGALSAAFIPVFSKYLQKDKQEAYQISSSVMNLVLLIFTALSVLIFIFARPFNTAITSVQFSPAQIKIAANLSRVMILAQLLFAVSSFLTGTIQAQQRFLIPALSPIAYNIGIILGIILLTPVMGIYGAAIGVVIGALFHLLLQIPLAVKLGFNYQPTIKLKHKGVKEMFRLMPPRVLAISVTQIELSALVYFATALSAGSLTILQIAQQLLAAPIRMFSVPIGQASLPFLSKDNAAGEIQKFKATFLNSFHQILYLAIPAGMLLLILRIPLVRIAYGSKEFPWATTLLTAKALAILSLSLFAQGAIHILTRAFYALHNTKTPFSIALLSVLVHIILASLAVFKWHFGILSLAATISISSILHALLLTLALARSLGGFSFQQLLNPPLKMFLSSSIMAIFLWVPMRLLDQFVFDTTRTLNLILLTFIVGLIGIAVYLLLSKLLKIEQLRAFLSLIKRIGNWKKVLQESDEVMPPTTQAEEIKPA